MEKLPEGVLPYMMASMMFMQVITIAFLLGIPTDKKEMVCVGIFDNPNAVRCYEQ